MARRFDKFTKAYAHSRIPFLVCEVVTNGVGEMVDLVCRYANAPAAALLDAAPEGLQNRRFCRTCAAARLAACAPLLEVAFSGSAASFAYETVLGRRLRVSCYQLQYGVCACILEEEGEHGAARSIPDIVAENLPGGVAMIEVGRNGMRLLSCNRWLCELTGYSRRDFLNRFSDDFSSLVRPAEWTDLLQGLRDAARSGQPLRCELRLLRRDGTDFWVELIAQRVSSGSSASLLYTMLLDIDRRRRNQEALDDAIRDLSASREQSGQLFDGMPGGYALFRLREDRRIPEPLRVSRGLSELTGYSHAELCRRLASSPLWRIHPEDRDGLAGDLSSALAGQPLRRLFRFQRKSGVFCWLILSAAPQRQEDGSTLLYAAFLDVTREKEAEEALRARCADIRPPLPGADGQNG
jgi:PAS domain S-box-containing protein